MASFQFVFHLLQERFLGPGLVIADQERYDLTANHRPYPPESFNDTYNQSDDDDADPNLQESDSNSLYAHNYVHLPE